MNFEVIKLTIEPTTKIKIRMLGDTNLCVVRGKRVNKKMKSRAADNK
jgi:hypothetical protein